MIQPPPITKQAHTLYNYKTNNQKKARGIRRGSVPMRELVSMAEAYVATHPELIAEARETVQRWTAEGFFGKRAAQSVRKDRELRTLDEQEQRQCGGIGQ
jgi:hypothetical protein